MLLLLLLLLLLLSRFSRVQGERLRRSPYILPAAELASALAGAGAPGGGPERLKGQF